MTFEITEVRPKRIKIRPYSSVELRVQKPTEKKIAFLFLKNFLEAISANSNPTSETGVVRCQRSQPKRTLCFVELFFGSTPPKIKKLYTPPGHDPPPTNQPQKALK